MIRSGWKEKGGCCNEHLFLVGVGTGLRGEEMTAIKFAGTKNSSEHTDGGKGWLEMVFSGITMVNHMYVEKVGISCM